MSASLVKSQVIQITGRRSFLRTLGACLVTAVSLPALSQSKGDVRRIAWYGGIGYVGIENWLSAYEHRLAEHGWRSGKSLTVRLFRSHMPPGSAPSPLRVQAAISEMLGWRPDVIVVSGTANALSLKRAALRTPVVFHGVIDPIVAGLVASRASGKRSICSLNHYKIDNKHF